MSKKISLILLLLFIFVTVQGFADEDCKICKDACKKTNKRHMKRCNNMSGIGKTLCTLTAARVLQQCEIDCETSHNCNGEDDSSWHDSIWR